MFSPRDRAHNVVSRVTSAYRRGSLLKTTPRSPLQFNWERDAHSNDGTVWEVKRPVESQKATAKTLLGGLLLVCSLNPRVEFFRARRINSSFETFVCLRNYTAFYILFHLPVPIYIHIHLFLFPLDRDLRVL